MRRLFIPQVTPVTNPRPRCLNQSGKYRRRTMSAQLDQVMAQAANDPDVVETQEWLDALEAVIEAEGPERAHYLMERMVDLARRRGAHIPFSSNTAYVNTIPAHLGEHCPGNLE